MQFAGKFRQLEVTVFLTTGRSAAIQRLDVVGYIFHILISLAFCCSGKQITKGLPTNQYVKKVNNRMFLQIENIHTCLILGMLVKTDVHISSNMISRFLIEPFMDRSATIQLTMPR